MGAISGLILTPSGRPAADCSVVPEAISHPRPPIPEMMLVTGPDGRYRWPLPPGTYRLTARCVDPASGGRQITGTVTDLVVGPGDEVTADIALD
ncbi:carboxypeptidase-like regulatory domain-containing protein [Thermomonospora umbrina]|uniref:carboxypeptidase-like regulatory domain-containing protein n=1 Tax=Thermomonospora umbrina TaxID=111806 RepID=UPI0014771C3E|nr:carboxypeptidase-like regulatory domain-containing protein [Thermomonospora umbrina]